MSQTISVDLATTRPVPRAKSLDVPVFGRRNLVVAAVSLAAALVSLIVLQHVLHINILGQSYASYYIDQAKSLLQGRWDLDVRASKTDIVTLNGKHYIVYPPFPAILMIPVYLIFGDRMSDILFTVVVSAFNLPLLFLLFEQLRASGLTRRSWIANLTFAVLLFFGSINLWLSLGGSMWFTAQIVGVTFTLLSLLVAFRRHYGWSAVLLGCAFFSRATALFGFPFLFYLAWQDAGAETLLQRFALSLWARKPDWSAVPWKRLLPPAVVALVVVVLFMARNATIFGSPFESGYNVLIQQRYPQVTNGPFNIRYVAPNIVANFFTFPRITFSGPFDRHPVLDMLNQRFAVSVFVTTPLFLYLFWRNRRLSPMRIALWGTVGLVVAMVLLFHASGWQQFGARYLYDGYPYAFLLLVLNEARLDWRLLALGALGIAINLLGAHQFWTFHTLHL